MTTDQEYSIIATDGGYITLSHIDKDRKRILFHLPGVFVKLDDTLLIRVLSIPDRAVCALVAVGPVAMTDKVNGKVPQPRITRSVTRSAPAEQTVPLILRRVEATYTNSPEVCHRRVE